MQQKTELDRIYKILKHIRTRGSSTYRLLTYCSVNSSTGKVILEKLKRLGYVHSFEEGRSIIWRATMEGVHLLDEMVDINRRLELL